MSKSLDLTKQSSLKKATKNQTVFLFTLVVWENDIVSYEIMTLISALNHGHVFIIKSKCQWKHK